MAAHGSSVDALDELNTNWVASLKKFVETTKKCLDANDGGSSAIVMGTEGTESLFHQVEQWTAATELGTRESTKLARNATRNLVPSLLALIATPVGGSDERTIHKAAAVCLDSLAAAAVKEATPPVVEFAKKHAEGAEERTRNAVAMAISSVFGVKEKERDWDATIQALDFISKLAILDESAEVRGSAFYALAKVIHGNGFFLINHPRPEILNGIAELLEKGIQDKSPNVASTACFCVVTFAKAASQNAAHMPGGAESEKNAVSPYFGKLCTTLVGATSSDSTELVRAAHEALTFLIQSVARDQHTVVAELGTEIIHLLGTLNHTAATQQLSPEDWAKLRMRQAVVIPAIGALAQVLPTEFLMYVEESAGTDGEVPAVPAAQAILEQLWAALETTKPTPAPAAGAAGKVDGEKEARADGKDGGAVDAPAAAAAADGKAGDKAVVGGEGAVKGAVDAAVVGVAGIELDSTVPSSADAKGDVTEVKQEAFLATGLVADALQELFLDFAEPFVAHMLAGLADETFVVASASAGLVADMARACGPTFVPFMKPCVEALVRATTKWGPRAAPMLTALGDIALNVDAAFVSCFKESMPLFMDAAESVSHSTADVDDDEADRVFDLRESCLDGFTGLLSGAVVDIDAKASPDAMKIRILAAPHLANIMKFVEAVLGDGIDEPCFQKVAGLTGDLLRVFRSDMKPYQAVLTRLLEEAPRFPDVEIRQLVDWIKAMVASIT
mmetsp:Transcript_29265/g.76673  ORF Transcript_29265/g.76673 Transcript_29265/m.76673 type:complete len:732 (+) Transcript_29265:154-2349(+)